MFEKDSDLINSEFSTEFKNLYCNSSNKDTAKTCEDAYSKLEQIKGFWKGLRDTVPRLIRILHSLHMDNSTHCYEVKKNGRPSNKLRGVSDYCAVYANEHAYTPSFWETYLDDHSEFK